MPPENDRQGTIRKPFVVACTLTRKGSHASMHPCCNPHALVKQHSTINIYPRGQVAHGAGNQTGQMDLSWFVHIGGEVNFLFVGPCPVPLIKVPGDKMQVSSGFSKVSATTRNDKFKAGNWRQLGYEFMCDAILFHFFEKYLNLQICLEEKARLVILTRPHYVPI